MRLSVIIVNYNVKYFLEQCLYTVQRATQGMEAELLVIDNQSTDGSLAYLKPLFPAVRFIANTENPGFAKACNQGLALAKGAYILFLNPDTLLPNDILAQCLAVFEADNRIGGMGVKMVDGSGRYLKESKRGFPTVSTSLFKLSGLAALFPRSRIFSRYYLGHLNENISQQVSVLAGAFMMIPRRVLEEVGSFDEVFFMYGEDVDLSYRIHQAGYKNWYLATPPIIHFKGESTAMGSLNYVKLFYKAMSLFVNKHYKGVAQKTYRTLIQMGIWVRAAIGWLGYLIKKGGLTLLNMGYFLLGFRLLSLTLGEFWPDWTWPLLSPGDQLGLAVLLAVVVRLSGAYDKEPGSTRRGWQYSSLAILFASILFAILPAYGLDGVPFVLGAVALGHVFIAGSRRLFPRWDTKPNVGDFGEAAHWMGCQPLAGKNTVQEPGAIARDELRADKTPNSTSDQKIIFCINNVDLGDIILKMKKWGPNPLYMFYNAATGSLISRVSSSNITHFNAIKNNYRLGRRYYIRWKQFIDYLVSIFFVCTFPIHLLLLKGGGSLFKDIARVLSGKKTWVGYTGSSRNLPPIKPGILSVDGGRMQHHKGAIDSHSTDEWYAKSYTIWFDVKLIIKKYWSFGEKAPK